MNLKCGAHGEREWLGDVVCADDGGGCGAVYQTRDEAAPKFAPADCVCGAPLMPREREGAPDREHFTARLICHACFVSRT